ncbi:MAG: FAD:protein FMN transferase [Planctomycetota bacterium]|jgi:thiamine biosynthesis lipoprotein|nr:FAD:protein FMN transferase [Planctomycetota bacterium]
MPESRKTPPGSRSPRYLLPILAAVLIGYFLARQVNGWRIQSDGAERQFSVMNTYARITIPPGHGSEKAAEELANLAEDAIRDVDRRMRPSGDASEIGRLNASDPGEWLDVSPATWTVVMESLRWHRLTDGAFDPTIGPIKRLFRFDKREITNWPSEEEVSTARERVGAEKLRFQREGMRLSWSRDGMTLDLGGIAKGYGVDQAIAALQEQGVSNALVEVGGEVRGLGQKSSQPPQPWRTGIMNPRGEGIQVLEYDQGRAIATSGDYNQFFTYQGERYTHIIDPRQGRPLPSGVAAVTVIHPNSCLAADALATTLMVLGREAGRDFLASQALGLFREGLEVRLYLEDSEGQLKQVTFGVDQQGGFSEEEEEAVFRLSSPTPEPTPLPGTTG